MAVSVLPPQSFPFLMEISRSDRAKVLPDTSTAQAFLLNEKSLHKHHTQQWKTRSKEFLQVTNKPDSYQRLLGNSIPSVIINSSNCKLLSGKKKNPYFQDFLSIRHLSRKKPINTKFRRLVLNPWVFVVLTYEWASQLLQDSNSFLKLG